MFNLGKYILGVRTPCKEDPSLAERLGHPDVWSVTS